MLDAAMRFSMSVMPSRDALNAFSSIFSPIRPYHKQKLMITVMMKRIVIACNTNRAQGARAHTHTYDKCHPRECQLNVDRIDEDEYEQRKTGEKDVSIGAYAADTLVDNVHLCTPSIHIPMHTRVHTPLLPASAAVPCPVCPMLLYHHHYRRRRVTATA